MKQTALQKKFAKINNHIRRMLWQWWKEAENKQGVYVERNNGTHTLLKKTNYKEASQIPSVKKVLLFSNNGEDLTLFIEWVSKKASKATVAKIMAISSAKNMIAYIWKHGLQKLDKKVWPLRQ